ncbi:bZIP transcription factor TGA10-like isoform X2 [Phoenix dactylifera]|uniref:BZIP transcription factor TGA10-like isoform X2 n=1 Tax=Phoenix dactylifera TaxID=42345 RepID=A0A8B7MUE9_PHODC|nr:bZIP transcription factor TGA10-like isoform X2 [Phoenix dactylifera]
MIRASSMSSTMSKDVAPYDLGELDPALFLYLDAQDHSSVQEQRQTLNIFPSQPMHVVPTPKGEMSLLSPTSSSSKQSIDLANPISDDVAALPEPQTDVKAAVKREGNRKGTASSDQEGPRTPDAKTLRRLAQNREAARKSRLRKKAYIQQLETSKMRLSQLEQELQRARAQGLLVGGGGVISGDQGLAGGNGGLNTAAAAMFDMEYGRWLEDHHRLMCDLRTAVQEHSPDNELRMLVQNCLGHYDAMTSLKSIIARCDVFHLLSGMWKTPAERCFMWIGGFRPSEIIKIALRHTEPLTEQQILGVCGLQQSVHETEEALSQGLEALYRSLSDTVISDALNCPSNMANYMGQMAVAVNKLSALEGFVRQADNLRQQTLHRLHQMLTPSQAARCFLAMAEHFHRLRSLSSLWLARPRQE